MEQLDTQIEAAQCDPNYREIEVIAYIGDHRIVGTAHFSVDARASSRRASDFIRSFSDNRLTLSRVRIYNKDSRELVDTTPFILLNMDKVDFMYGRDEGPCDDPE
jgi:hypothetical protein